jgi:hypothetical protein
MSFPLECYQTLPYYNSTTGLIDAAGRLMYIIGQVQLPEGAGSKVISAAGSGKIVTAISAATFANGGTTLRVGIQGMNLATNLADGVWSVYKDYVGGVDPITTPYLISTMGSGTQTLAHGDLIALGLYMGTRAGADQLTLDRFSLFNSTNDYVNLPYGQHEYGGLYRNAITHSSWIVFDDGTIGTVGVPPIVAPVGGLSNTTFGSATTPSELGVAFTMPYTRSIGAMGLMIGSIDTTETFDLVLYQDPYGTPVELYSVAQDPRITRSTGQGYFYIPIPYTELEEGETYAVVCRPTTTNLFFYYWWNVGNGFAAVKAAIPIFGDTAAVVGRSGGAGAFATVDDDYAPMLMLGWGAPGGGGGGGGTRAYGGIG